MGPSRQDRGFTGRLGRSITGFIRGSADATAGDKLNGSPVAFLNGTTAALDRFVTSGSDSINSAAHSGHLDDIHLAPGIQLGNPPIPEPSVALVSLLGLGFGLTKRRR